VECYLSTYKRASAFSKVYEMMPDFWEYQCNSIKNYADGKQDNKARYLIADKMSLQGVGYIELDYGNPEMPEVDIAILGEYQRKGYAFETARILFLDIFEYKFPNLPYYRGAADQVFFLGRPLGRFGLSSAGFFLGLPRFLGAGLGIGFERPRASSSSNT
jgi:hypothetical protein